MNPLVVFLVAGGAAMAVARSARRTAGKFKGTGERTYDGYWLPDNVEVVYGTGQTTGAPFAPAREWTDSVISLETHLPLVGTWEDAAEDWGLLGQVINPAALQNPETLFQVWDIAGDIPPAVGASVEGYVPFSWPTAGDGPQGWGEPRLVALMDRREDLESQEAVAYAMQRGLTLIIEGRNFDWASNKVWVTDECAGVFVGEGFWTDMAMEAPTLAEALAIPGNSAVGYADYLYSQGVDDAKAMATLIIQQISPDCAQWTEYESWATEIKAFHQWLRQMIHEDVLGIPFPG